eukprot:6490347-Amphidinium_carterae.2
MPHVSCAVPEREGRIHRSMSERWAEMLIDWHTPTSAEILKWHQFCSTMYHPDHLRSQLGHCPKLPWLEHGCEPALMGYTGVIRCLGFAPSVDGPKTVIDTTYLPDTSWQGVVLLERSGGMASRDPQVHVSIPQRPPVETFWHNVALGCLGCNELQDGSVVHHCLPQHRTPEPLEELDPAIHAHRIVVSLAETEACLEWTFQSQLAWPAEGRRKRKSQKTLAVSLAVIYTVSEEQSRNWCEHLLATQPDGWTHTEQTAWMPLPGLPIHEVCVWGGTEDFGAFELPGAKIVIFHCVPPTWVLDVLVHVSVLIATSMPWLQDQPQQLRAKGYHVCLASIKGETTEWCVASRPDILACRLELEGEYLSDSVRRAVWQLLHPDASVLVQNLGDCCVCVHDNGACHGNVSSEGLRDSFVESFVQTGDLSYASLSWRDLVDQIVTFLESHVLPRNTSRIGVGDQNGTVYSDGLRGIVLGATTARGYRVTPCTLQEPWRRLLPLLHELARRRPAVCQVPFLSYAITSGAVSAHEDCNDSLTSLISLGSFTSGGQLCVEDQVLETREKSSLLDGGQTHQVTPYHGGHRYAVACYVPHNAHKLGSQTLAVLRQSGFPVEWSDRCRGCRSTA